MEASSPSQQCLNPLTATTATVPDVKAIERKCPLCLQNGKISRVIPVFYNMREAIYTCEDKDCQYFMTDEFGNLQKFTKAQGALVYTGNVNFPAPNVSQSNLYGSSHSQSTTSPTNEIVNSSAYLDDIFNCQSSNADVESLINELSDDLQNFLENNENKKK